MRIGETRCTEKIENTECDSTHAELHPLSEIAMNAAREDVKLRKHISKEAEEP